MFGGNICRIQLQIALSAGHRCQLLSSLVTRATVQTGAGDDITILVQLELTVTGIADAHHCCSGRKNPWPLIATSSGLLVAVILPWVNCCATVASLVPIPTWLAPPPDSEAANTSANCACDALKPTVARVGHVIADHIQILGGCIQPAQSGLKTHDISPYRICLT